MKIKYFFSYLLLLFFGTVTCVHKKDQSALLLLLLASSQNSPAPSADGTTPQAPGNSGEDSAPQATPPTEETVPNSTSVSLRVDRFEKGLDICPLFGGMLLSFQSGDRATCNVDTLNPSCAREAVHKEDSTPYTIDPRSMAGYTFPMEQTGATITFPTDAKSVAYCFSRPQFVGTDIKMSAFRNRTSTSQECLGLSRGQWCIDRIPLFSPTMMIIPSEFPIVSAGRSNGHWSQLKYKTPENIFVTCRYAGEVTSSPILSYRASVVDAEHKKGYCVKTTVDYFETESGIWVSEERIPVGSKVVAISEVILEVNNCANKTFTKIEWNVAGWAPEDSSYLPLETDMAGIFEKPYNIGTMMIIIVLFSIIIFWRRKKRVR
ncbi:hypothetical protein EHQ58_17800 [Leptospira ognonensis]|uniref:Uncharacterized protein n=1 Tax=Leptospira ognonensis TaxID=2484945 RepID=A0A4R9JUJ5_9LEPT|nr:hypothetical protein [Leptospira ognonensis]TGL56472.1 hypothetical protein EHQ58_17800 [Leptospira ognonensis]